jgi:PhzF family phenazine biosynthesis protein
MTNRRFIQCDVFSPTPTKGNGLAVVLDGDGLTDEEMQGFAAWTNLAETTFLRPSDDPKADYLIRIFTPYEELPFAGHPTLGSCRAWLHVGGQAKEPGVVRQECGVGIVEIDTSGERLAFAAPPTKVSTIPTHHLETIVANLEIPAEVVVRAIRLDNGPVWQVLDLGAADRVLAVDSGLAHWEPVDFVGLIGAQPSGSESEYEVRLLASNGVEDPITGSLNAAIACWLREQGQLEGPMVVSQGTALGREGRVHITPVDDRILIGGDTHILIEGSVSI